MRTPIGIVIPSRRDCWRRARRFILGNTAEIVRKHYGKWSKGRQDNIDRLMLAYFASAPVTPQSHEKMEPVTN